MDSTKYTKKIIAKKIDDKRFTDFLNSVLRRKRIVAWTVPSMDWEDVKANIGENAAINKDIVLLGDTCIAEIEEGKTVISFPHPNLILIKKDAVKDDFPRVYIVKGGKKYGHLIFALEEYDPDRINDKERVEDANVIFKMLTEEWAYKVRKSMVFDEEITKAALNECITLNTFGF